LQRRPSWTRCHSRCGARDEERPTGAQNAQVRLERATDQGCIGRITIRQRHRSHGCISTTYLAIFAIVVILFAAAGILMADLARLRSGPAFPSEATITPSPSAAPPAPSVGEATPSQPAPTNTIVVELTRELAAGAPPVRVSVVDQSGRLTAASETGTVDPSTFSFDGRFGAYAEPGLPGRVHIVWVGGMCDSEITVTIAPDLHAITYDMGPQPDCDSLGVGRQLVLDFDGSIEVPAIAIIDVADQAAPTAGTRDYVLDCGSLGPDTCQDMANGIVADSEQGSPRKRVRSITFFDDCGSYTVIFDDGSGVTGNFDCAPP
jgi:hypothetical protein